MEFNIYTDGYGRQASVYFCDPFLVSITIEYILLESILCRAAYLLGNTILQFVMKWVMEYDVSVEMDGLSKKWRVKKFGIEEILGGWI